MENTLTNYTECDIEQMFYQTSQLIAQHHVNQLSFAAAAAHESNLLTNNVEFWKWMGRNYGPSGIFSTNESMLQYISQGAGKEKWVSKQIQGKGYEFDWITKQRNNLKNIFHTYDAGDVVNRAASDVTERNILTGKSQEYQMKAYTSKTNPDLKNTPKDMTVVTNTEKVNVVKQNGYQNVEEFQDAQLIKETTDRRMTQIKEGKAYTSYSVKNVAGTMAKSGLIGCVVGIGIEVIVSFRSWQKGQLTDQEYLKEILKAGGDAGITAGAAAGLMIPVSAAATAAGVTSVVTVPVAFVIGGAVNNIVAPCFGRGKYRQILAKAKYYQEIENVYDDLVISMQYASEQFSDFLQCISQQNAMHQVLKKSSMEMNRELKNMYDLI